MPNINVDISRYYQPKHKLRWTWQSDRDMYTSGYVQGEISGRMWEGSGYIGGSITGETKTHKVINSYIVTVRYEGEVNIGDRTIATVTVPNYMNSSEVANRARQISGISGDGYNLSCSDCLCLTCLCLTIPIIGCCCVPDCAHTKRKRRKERLNSTIEDVANSYFENHVAQIVRDADQQIDQRIQKLQAEQTKPVQHANQAQQAMQQTPTHGMHPNMMMPSMMQMPGTNSGMIMLTNEQLQMLLRAQMQQPAMQQLTIGQNSQSVVGVPQQSAANKQNSQEVQQPSAPILFSNMQAGTVTQAKNVSGNAANTPITPQFAQMRAEGQIEAATINIVSPSSSQQSAAQQM